MKYTSLFLLLAIFGGTWRLGHPTCVLESDFGFVLNCAFKKSGLFRVRNLGGIKAHVGLGFSVGDELGFKESLSNLESNRRRSVQGSSKLQAAVSQAQQTNTGKSMPMWPSPVMPTKASMIPAKSSESASTIPPFKPIPPAPERPSVNSNSLSANVSRRIGGNVIPTPALMGVVPSFNALPPSISRISTNSNVKLDGKKAAMALIVPIPANKPKASEKMSSSNFALRTLQSPNNELAPLLSATSTNSIQALSAATNISAEAIEAALIMRQQQLLQRKAATSTTTTTTTTTYRPPPPPPPKRINSRNKVMNAPREYYPVGYDKNFDDNFASRVDLPDTSFYCGDQKHFPGLYADEDLGCM
ncbi:hypothetical protein ILUMI_05458, partial [Ignelater luminosus]